MLILSLDTAGQSCAVCVWRDGVVLAIREERMARGQDARLVPLLLEVMAAAGVAFPQLDRIAVTRGPGSFTGLRIGLATARGLGLAADKPVIGIDRFSIHAAQQGRRGGSLCRNPEPNSSPLAGEARWGEAPQVATVGLSSDPIGQASPPHPLPLPRGEGSRCGNTEPLLIVLDSKRRELFCRYHPSVGAPHDAAMLTPEEIVALAQSLPHLLIAGDMPEAINARHVTYAPPTEPEAATAAVLAAAAVIGAAEFLPRPLYLRAPDVTFPAAKTDLAS